ncbi:hypothetical protein JCM11251_005083 [Rhodosporidiobolus azoricus]
MGKYYCDYCDVFLTHDSASVRRAHNAGRNHLSNVRDYYASLGNDKAQDLIDQIVRAFETGQRGPGQARILQMTAEGLPVGMTGVGAGGAPLRFAGPATAAAPGQMGGMAGGPPPPMGGMGGPPPPMGMGMGGPPPPMGMGGMGGPPPPGMGAPMRFGAGPAGGPPPPGFDAPPPGFRPPPGGPPPPGFFPPGPGGPPPPGFGAGAAPPPAASPTPSGGDGKPAGKLINGLNPERARMLGLI